MVVSSLKWQQKEKYLHFYPSKERIGREKFSQDTPLFSWQQELCCWDCLQSHVTNTPASPVWSLRCKDCFSQKSQCSLALFSEHQTPSAPHPRKISGYCCAKLRSYTAKLSKLGFVWSLQTRAKVFLQLHHIALIRPPLSWRLFCRSEKTIISISSTDLFFCPTTESETSGPNYIFLKMQSGFRKTVFSDTVSHYF